MDESENYAFYHFSTNSKIKFDIININLNNDYSSQKLVYCLSITNCIRYIKIKIEFLKK